MKILIFNQSWFAPEWRAAGHTVTTCGYSPGFDLELTIPLLHIDTVLSMLAPELRPDVIVFLDNSAPITIVGIEETDIPTVFYSVDVHHHQDLHKFLAHVFDEIVLAQKDYISIFTETGIVPHWMPLWASRVYEPSETKEYDAVFVGNLDKKLNPDRVRFFEDLGARVPVVCKVGEYWKIFPHSRLVLNQTVKGDLNFRVFEAMMSGSPLLTERTGNGLPELFNYEEHLFSYEKGNVDEAAYKIDYALSHPQEARAIGMIGRELILAKHMPIHRAEQMLKVVVSAAKKHSNIKFFAAMSNFTTTAKKYEVIDKGLAFKSLVSALRCGEEGLRRSEVMTTELACHAIYGALNYDKFFKAKAGEMFLDNLAEAYPDITLLRIAQLRQHLNSGRRQDAEDLAKTLSANDMYKTFCQAEEVISSILD